MQSFNHFLRTKGVSNDLRSLLYHIARAAKYINFSIRSSNTGKAGTTNVFGESQAALDVMSDDIIAKELERSELVALIASEEKEEPLRCNASRGNYMVAYDPLDGSSLIDVNLAIGSIFGIWDTPDIIGKPVGENMVASAYVVYGPRVTLVITIKNLGTHEFELNDVGEFVLSAENLSISPEYKCFAPGNLKVCTENQSYKTLLDHWVMGGKKLRYSGGMVPDINHILCKGQGIFTYPRDRENTDGKLRLLFECAPFALAVEEAGGIALNQEGIRILETIVDDCHQNTPIFIGSKEATEEAVDILNHQPLS